MCSRLAAVALWGPRSFLFPRSCCSRCSRCSPRWCLPRLGGAPNRVVGGHGFFFQAALLAGYAYAHLVVRPAAARAGRVSCILPFFAAAGRGDACRIRHRATRPFGAADARPTGHRAPGFNRPCSRSPRSGLPFVGPWRRARRLLQGWFVASGQPGKRRANPYVLFRPPSNLRLVSAALIAYPFVIEAIF